MSYQYFFKRTKELHTKVKFIIKKHVKSVSCLQKKILLKYTFDFDNMYNRIEAWFNKIDVISVYCALYNAFIHRIIYKKIYFTPSIIILNMQHQLWTKNTKVI